MHTHLPGVADDHVLIATFDEVKAAGFHLCQQRVVTDFPVHVPLISPDDAAAPTALAENSCACHAGLCGAGASCCFGGGRMDIYCMLHPPVILVN